MLAIKYKKGKELKALIKCSSNMVAIKFANLPENVELDIVFIQYGYYKVNWLATLLGHPQVCSSNMVTIKIYLFGGSRSTLYVFIQYGYYKGNEIDNDFNYCRCSSNMVTIKFTNSHREECHY